MVVAMLYVGTTHTRMFCAEAGGVQPGGANSAPTASSATASSGSPQTGSNASSPPADQTTPSAGQMVPLSGAEVLTPGFGGTVYSYILPAFEWTGYGDTNPTGFSSHGGIATQSTYTGNLTLQLVEKHSQLNLSYGGGAFFYSQPLTGVVLPNTRPFGTFQQLGVFEQVSARRWKWMIGDQGMYLPETPAGFAGFGGLTSFGGGQGGAALTNSPALGSSFNPDQSILTGYSRRVSDSATSQLEYDASGRSALTATASYGILQFLEPGFIDSRYWTFMSGYNHRLGQHDELAISYAHYYYRFSGPNSGILNRGLSILYGHQIAGRFSLQVSVAPTVNQVGEPLGGAATKSFVGTSDSLQYRAPSWDASVSFTRLTTGGGGVLPGAETDSLQGSMGRQLSRKTRGSISFSHAYDQSLAQESTLARRSQYEIYTAGFSLNRELGRHISAYLNYTFERQISNAPVCVGTSCTSALIRQIGGVGINWHAQPIKID